MNHKSSLYLETHLVTEPGILCSAAGTNANDQSLLPGGNAQVFFNVHLTNLDNDNKFWTRNQTQFKSNSQIKNKPNKLAQAQKTLGEQWSVSCGAGAVERERSELRNAPCGMRAAERESKGPKAN